MLLYMQKINSLVRPSLRRSRLLAACGLALLVILSQLGPLAAQTVIQGYGADETLQRGMLVTTKEDDETKVTALTDKNAEKMKGVIVDQNESPVTITSDDRKNFVAASGTYQVLVTNENGPIKQGDFLSISSLAGIAMKADQSQQYVVGRASGDFEGGGDALGTSDAAGKKVQFGRINVDLGVTRNPLAKNPEKDKIPDAIQRLSNSIADKPVSNVRIFIGLAILVVASIISGVMLYSGTRSSLISIGRNPLSKGTIFKGLVQVVLMSLIIFITGLFGVYLILKL